MEGDDEALKRWQSWLTDDGAVAGTVHRLESDRSRWRELREMVSNNNTIPYAADTLGWFWFHYASDAAIRIRRLADTASNSASLGRLLDEVTERAPSMTRTWFLDRWRARVDAKTWELFHQECADDWFDEIAGLDSAVLSVQLVADDARALKEAVAPVRLFVDKRLAHHNPKYDPALSYAEISFGIDVIGELFRKYVRLIRQVDALPQTDNTGWGAAFDVAWRLAPSDGGPTGCGMADGGDRRS